MLMILKKCHLILYIKGAKNFEKTFTGLNTFRPQTKIDKDLKEKVLNKAGYIFNELYYIYKERYNEEKNGLNTKDKKKLEYIKLRLTDDYDYKSEKEEKARKKSDKEKPPKGPTRANAHEFNKLVTKEETGMNSEVFQKHFNFQMAAAILKAVYDRNDKKENNELERV